MMKKSSELYRSYFRLVENTINIAVKEILFGPGMVTSSCESDRHDDSVSGLTLFVIGILY